jgi:cell division initiation protein
LKRLANDMLDRVERSRLMSKDFDPDKHLAMARREAKKAAFPNIDFERPIKEVAKEQEKPVSPAQNVPKDIVKEEPKEVAQPPAKEIKEPVTEIQSREPVRNEPAPKKVYKSFFDEIG